MSLNQIQLTTPEQVSLNHQIAGLGSRATAQIVDWLILTIIGIALSLCLDLLNKVLPPAASLIFNGYSQALVSIIVFVLFWGYFMLFEYFAGGRTPGKVLVGIRVIQDNGQAITFLTAVVRNLIRIIDFLPSFYLLGILMIFFHAKHKRIGDLAAGTLVVYQRRAKRKKKKNSLEREIEKKLAANPVSLELDDWTMQKIGLKEWKLIETYIKRSSSLDVKEKKAMLLQLAGILFPLLGLEIANKSLSQIENTFIALYLELKEDWQYESRL